MLRVLLVIPVLSLLVAPAAADDLIALKQKVLANGVTVLVWERPSAGRVGTRMFYRVDVAAERPGTIGLTHMLEHFLFKGSDLAGTTDWEAEKAVAERIERLERQVTDEKNRSRDCFRQRDVFADVERDCQTPLLKTLQAELDKLVAAQDRLSDPTWYDWAVQGAGGTNSTASTGTDWMKFDIDLPASKLELFMWTERARVERPVFRQFEAEREVVVNQIRGGDNRPESKFDRALQSMTYEASPYGWSHWFSDITRATREDHWEIFHKYFIPQNAIIVVVGEVKADDVFRMAEAVLGQLATGAALAQAPHGGAAASRAEAPDRHRGCRAAPGGERAHARRRSPRCAGVPGARRDPRWRGRPAGERARHQASDRHLRSGVGLTCEVPVALRRAGGRSRQRRPRSSRTGCRRGAAAGAGSFRQRRSNRGCRRTPDARARSTARRDRGRGGHHRRDGVDPSCRIPQRAARPVDEGHAGGAGAGRANLLRPRHADRRRTAARSSWRCGRDCGNRRIGGRTGRRRQAAGHAGGTGQRVELDPGVEWRSRARRGIGSGRQPALGVPRSAGHRGESVERASLAGDASALAIRAAGTDGPPHAAEVHRQRLHAAVTGEAPAHTAERHPILHRPRAASADGPNDGAGGCTRARGSRRQGGARQPARQHPATDRHDHEVAAGDRRGSCQAQCRD